jgi:hypothetical protein
VGALAYYLGNVAGLFHKRGGPRWYWEPHVLEAQRLGELVAAGHDLEGVVTPFLATGPNGAGVPPERARP